MLSKERNKEESATAEHCCLVNLASAEKRLNTEKKVIVRRRLSPRPLHAGWPPSRCPLPVQQPLAAGPLPVVGATTVGCVAVARRRCND